VRDPKSKVHIGWGAFNMLTREAYERVGTMEALRLEIVEDLVLGKRLKEVGCRSSAVFGPRMVTVHWASGAMGIVNNLTKNAFAIVEYRLWLALLIILAGVAYHILPFIFVFTAPGWTKLLFALHLFGIFMFYCLSGWIADISPVYFLLHPVSASLMSYANFRSTVVTLWRGGVLWRGTFYPLKELKAGSSTGFLPKKI